MSKMPTLTLFGFNTLATSGYLMFGYTLAAPRPYYIAPQGTEEALFGNGVTLKVTMTWDGSVAKLYLNDKMVQQSSYTTATPNWSAASNFDLGAYEYLTYGGYNSCDDIIDEFTVTAASSQVQATLPTISSLQCAAASLASNASTTCTVTLSQSTTSSTVVTLSNSAPTVVTVPSSVSVAANATSATFTATTGALLSDQTATVTATLNGSSKAVALSLVAPPVTLSDLQCAAASLASNASTTCTVSLSKSTAGSTAVALSNSAAAALTVPSSVSVAANATSATFTASAGALALGPDRHNHGHA